MLLELHVKNLALVERADVEFGEGLNILTGETGAGKSIILGSVNLALGGKAPREMIRKGADYAYVELVFSMMEPEKRRSAARHGMYFCRMRTATLVIIAKDHGVPQRQPDQR